MTKKNWFLETIALTGNVSTFRQMTADVCHSENPKKFLKNSGSAVSINIIKVYVTWSNNSKKKKAARILKLPCYCSIVNFCFQLNPFKIKTN